MAMVALALTSKASSESVIKAKWWNCQVCSPQVAYQLLSGNHLLQFCFSFFIRLHGQTELFGGCIILQSYSSFFFRFYGQHCDATTFSSLSFLSNSFSSQRFNLLSVARHCFSWSSGSDYPFSFPLVFFWFSFLLYLFRVLSSAYRSSVLQSLKLCMP